jgi:acetyltransferase-like isoleucine patch superfamily enzyme
MISWGKLKFLKRLLDDPEMEALYRKIREGALAIEPDPVDLSARQWQEFFYYHSLEHGLRQGLRVGRNYQVEPLATFFGFQHIRIGDDFVCGSFATIRAVAAEITIGNKVSLGPMTAVIGANHGFADLTRPIQDQPQQSEPVQIADNVWVGTGAIILPGVTIGEGAVIAAHAVVTRPVAGRTVVAGCPARVIRERR